MLRRQPLRRVHMVVQVLAAHVPVNGRPPVAPVAGAGAVVDIEHHVAPGGEQVVEHVLAVVGGPVLVGVLQVAGAVHEHHDRVLAAGLQLRRAVELGPDRAGAVGGEHRGVHAARLDLGGIRIISTGDTSFRPRMLFPLCEVRPDILLSCINGAFGNIGEIPNPLYTGLPGAQQEPEGAEGPETGCQ